MYITSIYATETQPVKISTPPEKVFGVAVWAHPSHPSGEHTLVRNTHFRTLREAKEWAASAKNGEFQGRDEILPIRDCTAPAEM